MSKLAQLFDGGIKRQYAKGQIVLYRGDNSESVYYISDGYVKVYDIDAKGNEKILLILGRGNIFPIIPDGENYSTDSYFYQTLSSTKLILKSVADFRLKLSSDIQNAKIMLGYYAEIIQDLTARVACIEATDAKHKIAQVIQYLVTQHGRKIGTKIVIRAPITHQAIADMAGTARETASLHLKEMQDNKVIVVHRHRIMVSASKLQRLIDELN